MATTALICTLLLSVIVNEVRGTESSCPLQYVRNGCYRLKDNNMIFREVNQVTNYKKYLLAFACKCALAVKKKSSVENEFQGFALRTDSGKTWFCYGRTASELETNKKGFERTVGCHADHFGDQCKKQDKTCVGISAKLEGAEFSYEFKENAAPKCKFNFKKYGCYDKKARKEDLLIFDRYNIKWDDISAYIHDLACRCNNAVWAANLNRHGNKYIGFALHYFGECYGRTEQDFEGFRFQDESSRCVGDQTFTTCEDEHRHCVGRSFSEYVYKLE